MNDRLIDWWRRRRLTSPRLKTLTFHESRSAVPTKVPRQTIAVVGTLRQPKWAVFECPCGRDHQITLNLAETRYPLWLISPGERGPSVHPSVDAYKPYYCHYWVKDGRVRFTQS